MAIRGARAAVAEKYQLSVFLSPNSYAAAKAWTTAFVLRLRDLGWIEGSTVQIEYRWEDGQTERTSEFINELVRLKVDIIVTHGVPNIVGAIKTTSAIPIIFPLATGPVGSGFVASLARPGGNATGLSIQSRRTRRQATRDIA